MDDDRSHADIDERIREAFRADPAAPPRIARRALDESPALDAGPRTRSFRPFAIAAAAALVLVLGIAAWRIRPPRSAPPQAAPPRSARPPLTSLSITGSGSIVVVDGNDGRRWIVGRSPAPPPPGRYVIVVPQ